MKKPIILKANDIEVNGVPEFIEILPLGHVTSSKGEFDVDEESYKSMKLQIAKRGVDLVVDYEHQTLKGVQAPAAGWIKELILKDKKILGRVEWTPVAAKYLENKEYRYLSPVIQVRDKDQKVMDLLSLALTNTPAIEGMTPIVNSINYEGGQNNMDLIKKLAQLLGLSEDATEEQVMEALTTALNEAKALKDSKSSQPAGNDNIVANKAVCELLNLKAGAPAADVAAKIMALKGGIIEGVNVLEELKALKQQDADSKAESAVTLALKSGKITPAQKEWAKSYALSDPKGFASFAEKAPQVVPIGEVVYDVDLKKDTRLDDATMLVCKQLGLNEDDIKKYGNGGN